MPTQREREYYRMGYRDGRESMSFEIDFPDMKSDLRRQREAGFMGDTVKSRPKRKLSAWQKYIKNKRNHIKYRDGKLNLKKMGVEFRRKKRRWVLRSTMSNSRSGLITQEPLSNSQLEYLWHILQLKKLG